MKSRSIVTPVALLVVLGAIVYFNWAGRPLTIEKFSQLLVFALPLAGIFALSATGLVVVYTTTGVFNFAQGAIGMLGAMVYWQLHVAWGWSTPISFVLAVFVFSPLLGIVLERVVMRRLPGKDLVVQLMVTVGLLFGFIGVANWIWDPNVGRSVPGFFGIDGFEIAGVTMTWHRLTTLVVAVALVGVLRFVLYQTRPGVSMRVVVDNPQLASLVGAPASSISMFAWALGSTLAGLAGVLIANETDMSPGGSLTLLIIPAFAAAAVGRMRSLPFTYVGALILAFAIQFSSVFLSFGGRWAQVPSRIPEIMLFVTLLLLPAAQLRFARTGGTRRISRVTTVREAAFGLTALVIVMAVLGAWVSPTNVSRLGLAMGLALVAVSIVPLTGWAGQVSFAPLAFAGVGAIVFAHWGGAEGSAWAIPLAALAAAPIGALLSLTAVRLQGLYLALATFAFAYFTRDVIFNQPFAFGGQSLVAERPNWFGLSFAGGRAYLVLLTIAFAIVGLSLVALRSSPFGRRLVALRDSEAASATVGVNVFETKVVVFTLSAFIAGLGGAFLAMFYGHVDATQFEAYGGLGLVLQLVVGGVAFVAGAIFAGVFQIPIQVLVDNVHAAWLQGFLRGLPLIAPGFAALGIIQNPDGAVVPMGEGFSPLLPWRHDSRSALRETRAHRNDKWQPESCELGLTEEFSSRGIAELERRLGVTRELNAEKR